MKFNWGIGITIFIVAFMTFILSFVVRASQANSDLYAEDYYEQEINYQEKIDAKNNAIGYKKDFKFNQTEDFFVVTFPASIENIETGQVMFYRPENADFDKTYQLELNNGLMAFPKENLKKGTYYLNISWKRNGLDYLVEQTINIE